MPTPSRWRETTTEPSEREEREQRQEVNEERRTLARGGKSQSRLPSLTEKGKLRSLQMEKRSSEFPRLKQQSAPELDRAFASCPFPFLPIHDSETTSLNDVFHSPSTTTDVFLPSHADRQTSPKDGIRFTRDERGTCRPRADSITTREVSKSEMEKEGGREGGRTCSSHLAI